MNCQDFFSLKKIRMSTATNFALHFKGQLLNYHLTLSYEAIHWHGLRQTKRAPLNDTDPEWPHLSIKIWLSIPSGMKSGFCMSTELSASTYLKGKCEKLLSTSFHLKLCKASYRNISTFHAVRPIQVID